MHNKGTIFSQCVIHCKISLQTKFVWDHILMQLNINTSQTKQFRITMKNDE